MVGMRLAYDCYEWSVVPSVGGGTCYAVCAVYSLEFADERLFVCVPWPGAAPGLAPLRRCSQGWHHVFIGDVRPDAGANRASPLWRGGRPGRARVLQLQPLPCLLQQGACVACVRLCVRLYVRVSCDDWTPWLARTVCGDFWLRGYSLPAWLLICVLPPCDKRAPGSDLLPAAFAFLRLFTHVCTLRSSPACAPRACAS